MFHMEQKKWTGSESLSKFFLYIAVKKLFPIGVFPVV